MPIFTGAVCGPLPANEIPPAEQSLPWWRDPTPDPGRRGACKSSVCVRPPPLACHRNHARVGGRCTCKPHNCAGAGPVDSWCPSGASPRLPTWQRRQSCGRVLYTSRTKRPEGGGPDAGDVGKTGGELPSSPAPPSPPDPPPLRRPGGSSEAHPGDGGGRGARQLRVRAGGCVTCHTRDGLVPAAVSRPQSQAAPLSRPPSSQAFPGVCRFRTRGTIACAQLLAGPPFLSPVLAATPAGWARRGKKRKRGPRRWRWGQLPSSRGAPRWSRRTSRRASPPPSPQPSPADVKCVSQPPPLSPDPSSPPCPPPGPSCRRRRSHPSPRLPSSGGNPCHRRRTTGSPFPLSCISSSSLHPPVFSPPALSRTRWRELWRLWLHLPSTLTR